MGDKWGGYIKDYDGGTLMECVISPKINYLTVLEMLEKQREACIQKIRMTSKKAQMVYSGLEHFKSGKSGKCPKVQLQPIFEAGWKPSEEVDQTALRLHLEDVFNTVKNHPQAWPFQKPVDPNEVIDYYQVIKSPIDLTMIESRLKEGNYYITKDIFR